MNPSQLIEFVGESNRIEGIRREPTEAEIMEADRFMGLEKVEIRDLIQFVSIYAPGKELRERRGMNVIVGNYIPPAGDITIRTRLQDILTDALWGMLGGPLSDKESCNPYIIHQRYESLHPFMDGNGRSGRMLWLWMMREAPLGFLHTWYYQSLRYGGKR